VARKIDIVDGSEAGEDPKLIRRVDAMMDPSVEEKPVVPLTSSTEEQSEASSDLPPIDIFSETKSAPPLTEPSKGKSKKAESGKEKEDSAPAYEVVPETDPEPTESVDPKPTEVQVNDGLKSEPKPPEEYDDPAITKAINDIVAEESDEVLSAEDKKLERKRAKAAAVEKNTGHPIFWALVVIVCLVAIAIGVFIFDPNLHNPLARFHWSSIRRHL
jgi:hypothetical protein